MASAIIKNIVDHVHYTDPPGTTYVQFYQMSPYNGHDLPYWSVMVIEAAAYVLKYVQLYRDIYTGVSFGI